MDNITKYNDDDMNDEMNNIDIGSLCSGSDSDNLPEKSMSSIDKISLGFLVNKAKYRKYIEKRDPDNQLINQEYIYELNKYKDDIMKMTLQLLDEPDIEINADINELFKTYTKSIINYYTINKSAYSGYSDTIDASNDRLCNKYNDDNADMLISPPRTYEKCTPSSFFGKTITFV
jgi:predicted RNase H-related nuclease YkuK (DUF458 family)